MKVSCKPSAMSCKYFAQSSQLIAHRPSALGIEAASFASGASKDIAESPTAELEAEPERPIPHFYTILIFFIQHIIKYRKNIIFAYYMIYYAYVKEYNGN